MFVKHMASCACIVLAQEGIKMKYLRGLGRHNTWAHIPFSATVQFEFAKIESNPMNVFYQ